MDERFIEETERLKRAWSGRRRDDLAAYLVQDVEDPRINVQSILARHFLIEHLFGDKYLPLMGEELRFSAVMNWLLKRTKEFANPHQVGMLLDGLLEGSNEVDGLRLPQFLLEAFERLPIGEETVIVPDYVSDALIQSQVQIDDDPIDESVLNTFARTWEMVLKGEKAEKVSVIEGACGSANDYRFMDWYGIGGFLDYKGIDLCEKNIANALDMFGEVDFAVGNVLEIEAEDDSFDCFVVADLLEHLSVEAMDKAIEEMCRVTRRALCVGFFNMAEADEHVVTVKGDYHWNKLSRTLVQESFGRFAADVETVHIDKLLIDGFGFDETQNKGAYTLVARL